MTFKKRFVEGTKQLYKKSVGSRKIREEGQKVIIDYFNQLKVDLKDEIDVASGEFDIVFRDLYHVQIILNERELFLHFDGDLEIPVELKCTDYVKHDNSYITIDVLDQTENGFVSRNYNSNLNEELLDKYLELAFADELNDLLEYELNDR